MRTWRVGTFSMGASLLFLGIILLLSQLLGFKLSHIMMSWWPVILVVLGIEILVYLYLSKQEKPLLRYDFLSIFFVGVIGTIGIGCVLLSSTGVLAKMEEVIDQERQSFELPAFSQQVDKGIERVVLKTDRDPITVEGTTDQEVSVFGTYNTFSKKAGKLITAADDYIFTKQKGDTLYINIKGFPNDSIGPFNQPINLSATILVPTDVKLEIQGQGTDITVRPRNLISDWNVDQASNVSLHLEENSDIKVSAIGISEYRGQDSWKIEEHETSNEEYENDGVPRNATYKIGKGTHHINISNTYNVSLNTLH